MNKQALSTAVLAALLGTYLDLYFVGKGLYSFPYRPFPELFSINILFTLLVLPVFIITFLYWTSQINRWGKVGVVMFISLFMTIMEKLTELLGFFVHSDGWKHNFTFFGYMIFLTVITVFHSWIEGRLGK
ncbi:CBO0543 family protein [Neobacillus dielmonensis]|uniref:CBO0543 family protein n=1 Tax=Neobacillus dielmonensis TaxID=1347369 RepID=UPI0005A68B11|nr:CBO0543 family protein [Neobacillus dielmonensis]